LASSLKLAARCTVSGCWPSCYIFWLHLSCPIALCDLQVYAELWLIRPT